MKGRSGFLGSLGFGAKKDRECGLCHESFLTFCRQQSLPIPPADGFPAAMKATRGNPKVTKAYDSWAADQRSKAARRNHHHNNKAFKSAVSGNDEQVWIKKNKGGIQLYDSAHGNDSVYEGGEPHAPSVDSGILLKKWSRRRLGEEEFDLPDVKPRGNASHADSDNDSENDKEVEEVSGELDVEAGDVDGGGDGDGVVARPGDEVYYYDEKTGQYYAQSSGNSVDGGSVVSEKVRPRVGSGDVSVTISHNSDVNASTPPSPLTDAPKGMVSRQSSDVASVVTQYFLDETTGKYCYQDAATGQYYYCEKPSGILDIIPEEEDDQPVKTKSVNNGSGKRQPLKHKPSRPVPARKPSHVSDDVQDVNDGDHEDDGVDEDDCNVQTPPNQRVRNVGHSQARGQTVEELKGKVASEVKALKAQLKRTTQLAVTAAVAAKQASMQYTSPDIALKSWLTGVNIPEPNVKQIIATYKRIMREATMDRFGSRISVRQIQPQRPSPVFRSDTMRLLPRTRNSYNHAAAAAQRPTTMVQIVLPNGGVLNQPGLSKKGKRGKKHKGKHGVRSKSKARHVRSRKSKSRSRRHVITRPVLAVQSPQASEHIAPEQSPVSHSRSRSSSVSRSRSVGSDDRKRVTVAEIEIDGNESVTTQEIMEQLADVLPSIAKEMKSERRCSPSPQRSHANNRDDRVDGDGDNEEKKSVDENGDDMFSVGSDGWGNVVGGSPDKRRQRRSRSPARSRSFRSSRSSPSVSPIHSPSKHNSRRDESLHTLDTMSTVEEPRIKHSSPMRPQRSPKSTHGSPYHRPPIVIQIPRAGTPTHSPRQSSPRQSQSPRQSSPKLRSTPTRSRVDAPVIVMYTSPPREEKGTKQSYLSRPSSQHHSSPRHDDGSVSGVSSCQYGVKPVSPVSIRLVSPKRKAVSGHIYLSPVRRRGSPSETVRYCN